MSAFHRSDVLRANTLADVNNVRRRGRDRLHFLQPGRTPNIAAVVRQQAPLPVASIIPPPPDAAQTGQWSQYRHNAFQEPPAPDRRASSSSELHGNVLFELPAPLGAIPEERSTTSGTQQADSIVRSAATSPHSHTSHTSNGWNSQYSPGSVGTNTVTPNQVALSQAPTPTGVASASRQPNAGAPSPNIINGFDCPLRAGPDGPQRCNWKPPRDDIGGFPSLARVKEHVGSHGLLCPNCGKVFTVPTRYRDHRRNQVESGNCSALGAEKNKFPKHLSSPPDVILAFFKRPPNRASKAEAELWLDGYKILHPDWEHQNYLPSSSYRSNVGVQRAKQNRNRPLQPPSQPSEASNSSGLPATGRISGPESRSSRTSELFVSPISPHNLGTPDYDYHEGSYLPASNTNDASGEVDDSRWWDEMVWAADGNGAQIDFDILGNAQEPTSPTMSGALPSPGQHTTGPIDTSTSQAQQATGSRVEGLQHQSRALEPAHGQQPGNSATAAAGPSTEASSQAASVDLPTSTNNPYRRVSSQEVERIDSAMDLCEPRSSSSHQHTSLTSALGAPAPSDLRPSRATNSSTPARRNAMRRIEKLVADIMELHAKLQVLNTENRTLHARVSEVESDKQKLEMLLLQIRMEVMMWEDSSDEEMMQLDESLEAARASMQKIKRLFPD